MAMLQAKEFRVQLRTVLPLLGRPSAEVLECSSRRFARDIVETAHSCGRRVQQSEHFANPQACHSTALNGSRQCLPQETQPEPAPTTFPRCYRTNTNRRRSRSESTLPARRQFQRLPGGGEIGRSRT